MPGYDEVELETGMNVENAPLVLKGKTFEKLQFFEVKSPNASRTFVGVKPGRHDEPNASRFRNEHRRALHEEPIRIELSGRMPPKRDRVLKVVHARSNALNLPK